MRSSYGANSPALLNKTPEEVEASAIRSLSTCARTWANGLARGGAARVTTYTRWWQVLLAARVEWLRNRRTQQRAPIPAV